jgi:glycosyltransferase involved in cell wall biosynthesis
MEQTNANTAAANNMETALEAKPMVSLVVPGFNEAGIVEKNLNILFEYMESLEDEYSWELVFINDGSTDETGDLAENIARNRDNVKILHHMFNFRLGQALRYAFSNCRGDYVIVLDLDLSYEPAHIEKMLTKLRESRAKIVIASPYMKGGNVSNVPWLRKILSKWANRYLCLTAARDKFSDKITTITGMVRAYDHEFLSRLNLKAMDVDINAEIIYKAMILRARIVEVPAHLNWSIEKSIKKGGNKRKSSMRIIRSIIQSLISGFIFRPFMFFVLPGLLLLLPTFYTLSLILWYTYNHYAAMDPSIGSINYRFGISLGEAFQTSPHSFLVGGISLIVAIQLISLGLLALQKKRYFEELFHLGSTIHTCSQEHTCKSETL